MKGYLKHVNCRICQKTDQETRDQIDKAILEGQDLEKILDTFKEDFPPEAPLSIYALKYHKAHLLEFVAMNKVEALAISEDGKIQLAVEAAHSTEITKYVSDTILNVAQGVIDEQRVLHTLIIDSVRDLAKLNELATSSKESVKIATTIIRNKDLVRQHLAEQIQRSVQLRLQAGGDIDKRMEVQKVIKAMASCCIRVMKSMKFSEEQANIFGEKLKAEMEVDRLLYSYLD